jgi:hypothetical protein
MAVMTGRIMPTPCPFTPREREYIRRELGHLLPTHAPVIGDALQVRVALGGHRLRRHHGSEHGSTMLTTTALDCGVRQCAHVPSGQGATRTTNPAAQHNDFEPAPVGISEAGSSRGSRLCL